MSYKKVIVLLITFTAIITSYAVYLEWLPYELVSYGYKFEISVVEPLYLFGLALSFSLLVLLFRPKEIFVRWLRFNLWYLPMVALLIAVVPYGRDMLMLVDKRDIARFFAVLHVCISLYIFFVAKRRAHKK